MRLIHLDRNPYAGFPAQQWGGTWYGDHGARREIFGRCIDLIKPKVIVEVGSFVGESAIHMAQLVQQRGMDSCVLCVDTWYGGFDHWKGAREKIVNHFGRPDFFYKFMANVIANRCENVIVPLATDSLNAARILEYLGIKADLVYIDGSHEEGDVLRDYKAYWPLLNSGGGMLCDDWSGHFPGVLEDGQRFIAHTECKPVAIEGEKVLFVKT